VLQNENGIWFLQQRQYRQVLGSNSTQGVIHRGSDSRVSSRVSGGGGAAGVSEAKKAKQKRKKQRRKEKKEVAKRPALKAAREELQGLEKILEKCEQEGRPLKDLANTTEARVKKLEE